MMLHEHEVSLKVEKIANVSVSANVTCVNANVCGHEVT
jgi:hypothetical protein